MLSQANAGHPAAAKSKSWIVGKRTAHSRSCVRLNGDRSGRRTASVRPRATHETPAVRFGTEPEQRCQRYNRHDFEPGDRPLITEADMKRVLDRVCGCCEQYSQLIRQARHQPTGRGGGKLV